MAGNNSTVGLETVTFTDNLSFDGTERGGAMTTNGELWIGSTIGRHVKKGSIVSPMGTVTIGYASPNITIDLVGGGAAIQTLTGNTGGAISPVLGNINTIGTGSITIAGSGNTLTSQLTGLTNHNVLIGAGTATITKVAPSATAGVPLISNGASSDPVFGTALVAGGGTGNVTQAAYSLVAGGTTTTGAFQAVGPNASSNAILMAQGTSTLPAFTTTGTPYVTGISFNAGTNVLNSYAFATTSSGWTPVVASDGTQPTITYGVQRGAYVKIGRVVFIQCLITFSAYTAGTGNVLITGLPFTPGTSTTFPPGSIVLSNVTFAGTYCVALVNDGTSSMSIYTCTTAASSSQIQSTNLSVSSTIGINVSYITNS